MQLLKARGKSLRHSYHELMGSEGGEVLPVADMVLLARRINNMYVVKTIEQSTSGWTQHLLHLAFTEWVMKVMTRKHWHS